MNMKVDMNMNMNMNVKVNMNMNMNMNMKKFLGPVLYWTYIHTVHTDGEREGRNVRSTPDSICVS